MIRAIIAPYIALVLSHLLVDCVYAARRVLNGDDDKERGNAYRQIHRLARTHSRSANRHTELLSIYFQMDGKLYTTEPKANKKKNKNKDRNCVPSPSVALCAAYARYTTHSRNPSVFQMCVYYIFSITYFYFTYYLQLPFYALLKSKIIWNILIVTSRCVCMGEYVRVCLCV